MYKQFVAWSCNGSSVAPLKDYMNNPRYQEFISEDDYFDVFSDERIYLNLRARSGYVKEAENLNEKLPSTFYKLKLRVCVHALGEYLYILTKNGLTLRHRTYAINQTDEDLLE